MYTIKIQLTDTRCSAALTEAVPVTTGCRGQFQAVLEADEGWAELDKTVIFYTGSRASAVYLGQETTCLVPPEVLSVPAAMLTVGVQGAQGDVVRCSTLAQVAGVTPGAFLPAALDPTAQPDLYSQLLAAIHAIHSAAVNSVNGQTGAVILGAADVGARPDTWTPTAAEVGARPDTWTPTAAEVGARPDTWTPTAAEVGARPDTWTPTAEEVGALPADTVFPTELPAVSTADAGKFLRVSAEGAWTAEALENAEGGSY